MTLHNLALNVQQRAIIEFSNGEDSLFVFQEGLGYPENNNGVIAHAEMMRQEPHHTNLDPLGAIVTKWIVDRMTNRRMEHAEIVSATYAKQSKVDFYYKFSNNLGNVEIFLIMNGIRIPLWSGYTTDAAAFWVPQVAVDKKYYYTKMIEHLGRVQKTTGPIIEKDEARVIEL